MEITSDLISEIDELLNKTRSVSAAIMGFGDCVSKTIELRERLKDLEYTQKKLTSLISDMQREVTASYDEYEAYKDDSRKMRARLYNDWDYAQREKMRYESELTQCLSEIEQVKQQLKTLEAETEKYYAEIFSGGDPMVEAYKKLKQGSSQETRPHSPYENLYGNKPFGE